MPIEPPSPRVPPAELFDDFNTEVDKEVATDLETYEPGGERDLDNEVPF